MRRALLLVLVATGCIDSFTPEVGPLSRGVCVDDDSDPSTDVSLSGDLMRIAFDNGRRPCNGCHTPSGASPIGIAVGGLDLSTYATLRRGGSQSGSDIVIPGQPCASVLVQKLGDAPPFGTRMPLEGPPLPLELRQLVADWIAEGAVDN